MKLYVIRGAPGSGKSTLARKICDQFGQPYSRIAENDNFFMINGQYKWRADIHYIACQWCEGKAAKNLYQHGFAVVPNVFSRYSSFQTYVEHLSAIGEACNVIPELIVLTAPLTGDTAFFHKNNVHNVPFDVIQNMQDKWQSSEQELRDFVCEIVGDTVTLTIGGRSYAC
jgi:predicted kinase